MRKKSLAIIGLLIGSILIGGCSRNTKDMVDIRKLGKEASIAESGEKLRKHLEETMASDMYIVSIEQVDYENHKEEILNQVSKETKMYREYKEI